jgi:hypothetical protein
MGPKRRLRRPRRPLHVEFAAISERPVSKKFVKLPAAVFLLFPALALTFATLRTVEKSALSAFWTSPEGFWLLAGFGAGTVWFFAFPPLRVLYVLGHELTHALWVWLHRGRVLDFESGWFGGKIETDRTNTAIVLAPYFFPIFTSLWIVSYGIARLSPGVPANTSLLLAGIGFTWVLHLAFTIWMILRGQPDLEYGGHFFSLVVIYIGNLAFIASLLVLTSPGVTWRGFASDFLAACVGISSVLRDMVESILLWAGV